MFRRSLSVALLTAGLSSLACTGLGSAIEDATVAPEPVPDSHLDYIGVWEGEGARMEISADSIFRWETSLGNNRTTSVEAPVQSWHDTGLNVGLGPFVKTYVVTRPPTLVDGVWHVTVDGFELSRPSSSVDDELEPDAG